MTDGPGEKRGGPGSRVGDAAGAPVSAGSEFGDDGTAAARGWVVPPGGSRVDALFLVSSERLGIGRSESHDPPMWFDLARIMKLDAIGEPDGGLLHVELLLDDSSVIAAGWPESFCTKVVDALTATKTAPTSPETDGASGPAGDGDSTFSVNPVVRRRSRLRRGSEQAAPSEATEETRTTEPVEEAGSGVGGAAGGNSADDVDDGGEVDGGRAGDVEGSDDAQGADGQVRGNSDGSTQHHAALELEDVTYLGGHSRHPKRRKRCVATLTTEGLELRCASETLITLDWADVRAIETQNSDEARFRTNTKIHRDSSALVLDCTDGSALVLEARDCPTVPLRAAISQLLGGLAVEVI